VAHVCTYLKNLRIEAEHLAFFILVARETALNYIPTAHLLLLLSISQEFMLLY